MNDVQYFEAARHLGYRMLREGRRRRCRPAAVWFPPRHRPARRATSECAILARILEAQRARYRADDEAARKVIAVGESPVPGDVAPAELAAYTMVANLLLNLDEVVTKN